VWEPCHKLALEASCNTGARRAHVTIDEVSRMDEPRASSLRWAWAARQREADRERVAVGGWCAPTRGIFGLLESSGAEGLRALETYMRAQTGDALAFAQAHQSLMARSAWGHALVAGWDEDAQLLSVAQVGDAHWVWVRAGEVLTWRWGRIPVDDYYEAPPVEYTGGTMVATRDRRERATWLGILDGLPHPAPWPHVSAMEARAGDALVLLPRRSGELLHSQPGRLLEALEAPGEAACWRLLELGGARGMQGAMVLWL